MTPCLKVTITLCCLFLMGACAPKEDSPSNSSRSPSADRSDSPSTDRSDSGSTGRLQPSDDNSPPTCIEKPPPGGINACFATPGEYARWKSCWLKTNNSVKCYVNRNDCPARHTLTDDACVRECVGHAELRDDGECHPLPLACPQGEGWERDNTGLCSEIAHTTPPIPQYPAGSHFQFDYIIRPLTNDQRNRIRSRVLDMKTLIDRPVCRFVGANHRTPGGFHVRARGTNSAGDPTHSITYMINGASPGCDDERVLRFQAELSAVAKGHQGLTYLDDTPLAFVRTSAEDYIMWFSWGGPVEESPLPPPVIYFYYDLPSYDGPGHPMVAEFEFLGQQEADKGVYILGFYGSVDTQ